MVEIPGIGWVRRVHPDLVFEIPCQLIEIRQRLKLIIVLPVTMDADLVESGTLLLPAALHQ
jgi:hypothetical protein